MDSKNKALKRIAAFRESLEASEVEDRDYFIEALKQIEAGAEPIAALGLKRKKGRPRADSKRLGRWVREAHTMMKHYDAGLSYEEAAAAACAELYPDDGEMTKERSIARHYDLLSGPLSEMAEGCAAQENPAGVTAVVRTLAELRRRGEERPSGKKTPPKKP